MPSKKTIDPEKYLSNNLIKKISLNCIDTEQLE